MNEHKKYKTIMFYINELSKLTLRSIIFFNRDF